MTVYQILFLIIISTVFALLEIQIEGTAGWAKNLPTWRIKNPFKKIINWPTLVDGYHLYVWILSFFIFHGPFFFGFPFNLKNELLVLELLLVFFTLEDFLWFVFNPAWGIKKYFTTEIPWHKRKILYIPQDYWIFIIIIGIIEVVKHQLT
ncbi:hypothetical protein ACFL1Q_02595 [Patescibacteria group bacterium]